MRVATCFLLVLFTATTAFANTLTYGLATDKGTYSVGETVNWRAFVTLSNRQEPNLGAAIVSFDLSESGSLTLSPATIASPFDGYNFKQTGQAGAGTLNAIGAGMIGSVNLSVIQLSSASDLGPTDLATGSFTAGGLGAHVLTASQGNNANAYFINSSGSGTSSLYNSVAGGSASFNVVPEPSTMALGLLGFAVAVGYSLRRRSKAKAAEAQTD